MGQSHNPGILNEHEHHRGISCFVSSHSRQQHLLRRLPSHKRWTALNMRYVISGQASQALRLDDGHSQSPLTLQVSTWHAADRCLISFQTLSPKPINLAPIQEPYGLNNRQVQLLQHFTAGVPLAGIAADLRLRPQYVREAFSSLYAKFDLQNQLQLLSALKSLPLIHGD